MLHGPRDGCEAAVSFCKIINEQCQNSARLTKQCRSVDSGAKASTPDADGHTALHKAAQQACLCPCTVGATLDVRFCLSALAKDEYYNPLTLKLERKMQKFDLRLAAG